MNRFKFRAWDKDKNRMWSISQISFDDTPTNLLVTDGNSKGFYHLSLDLKYQPSMILMQSTGLKDCEGKEIFDGDLMKSPVKYAIYQIKWRNSGWGMVRVKGSHCFPIFTH